MQNFLEVTFSKKMSANDDDFSSVYFVYNIQLSSKGEVNSGGYTAILRKVVRQSARGNPKRYCGLFWVHCFSKKFERMVGEAVDICLRVLKVGNKSRCDSYSVRNSVLILSHITFRDCRVHIFSENLSRNSCILRREASKYISSAMNQPCGWYLYIIHKIYTVKAVSIFIFEFKTVQAVT